MTGRGRLGLLVMIAQSGMIGSASLDELKRLTAEAEEEAAAAELDFDKAEDTVSRLEDKLSKAQAELKRAQETLAEAVAVQHALAERLGDGVEASGS